MKPGDLVRFHHGAWPPGTLAILLEILDEERDGPSMDTLATVLIDDSTYCVYLHSCQEIRDEDR